jgi:hypothetical protein
MGGESIFHATEPAVFDFRGELRVKHTRLSVREDNISARG